LRRSSATSSAALHAAGDPQHALVLLRVDAALREVVERRLRGLDDVPLHELGAFLGALHVVLERALPLDDGPAGLVVLRALAEDPREVALPVAGRAEAPRALGPAEVAAVDADAAGRPELGVLHVEDLDAVVIEVEVLEVVELLQHEVARVVEQLRA